MAKKEKFDPPFEAFYWRCKCVKGVDIVGYLYATLKEAKDGNCEGGVIQKVRVVPVDTKIIKNKKK